MNEDSLKLKLKNILEKFQTQFKLQTDNDDFSKVFNESFLLVSKPWWKFEWKFNEINELQIALETAFQTKLIWSRKCKNILKANLMIFQK